MDGGVLARDGRSERMGEGRDLMTMMVVVRHGDQRADHLLESESRMIGVAGVDRCDNHRGREEDHMDRRVDESHSLRRAVESVLGGGWR